MSETTTEQGNKLIAEFMGFYHSGHDPVWKTPVYVSKDGQQSFVIGEMNYHSSWDWLMPVVEKIGKLKDMYVKIIVDDNLSDCTIDNMDWDSPQSIINHSPNSPLEATWLSVIQFIQWYNNQKQNP